MERCLFCDYEIYGYNGRMELRSLHRGGSRHSIKGGGGGGHEMRLNAKGTVGSFGERKINI